MSLKFSKNRICSYCKKTEFSLQKELLACKNCVTYHKNKVDNKNWVKKINFYCSKQCQLNDWPIHYKLCSSINSYTVT